MKLFEKKLKYANDYKTDLVYDEKGRVHKKVTYVGPMVPFITDAGTVTKRFITVAVLAVIMAVCLIICEGLEHGSAWFAGVTIPLACALFPAFYLIAGVCTLSFKGESMRRDRYYHSIVRILKSGAGIIPLAGISFLADFVYRLIYADWLFFKGDILYLVLLAVVVASTVGIVAVTRSVDVDERELLKK